MSCTLREEISEEFQDPNKKAPFMISSAFGGSVSAFLGILPILYVRFQHLFYIDF